MISSGLVKKSGCVKPFFIGLIVSALLVGSAGYLLYPVIIKSSFMDRFYSPINYVTRKEYLNQMNANAALNGRVSLLLESVRGYSVKLKQMEARLNDMQSGAGVGYIPEAPVVEPVPETVPTIPDSPFIGSAKLTSAERKEKKCAVLIVQNSERSTPELRAQIDKECS